MGSCPNSNPDSLENVNRSMLFRVYSAIARPRDNLNLGSFLVFGHLVSKASIADITSSR